MSLIAITGATGKLGRLVIEQLKNRVAASQIVALVRTPSKAANLGVTAREADYDRPETLVAALAGVETLLLISSSEVGKREAQHGNVIDAAKKAGVRRIAYTSLLRATTSPLTALATEHIATEKLLKASGLIVTLLRNGWYTENYTGQAGGAVANGALIGAAGEGKISSAARKDYAEAAAVVLTTPGHEGKVYELAGDESYTLAGLAAEISSQTGKTIPYKNLTETEYAAALAGFGMPAPVAAMLANLDTGTAAGGLFDDGHQLSHLIGHPTTPLAKCVAAALKA